MKNKIKIRVPKHDRMNWNVSEMKFDPFWAELLVEPKTIKRCKSAK